MTPQQYWRYEDEPSSHGLWGRINRPHSVAHGVASTGAITGLALINPRALTGAQRAAYRSALAALAGWTVWVSLRPDNDLSPDWVGPFGRAGFTTGAVGAVFGLANAGESMDARLHDRLVRAGVRRPRLWLAAGDAALSAASWWAGRVSHQRDAHENYVDTDHAEETLVELPEPIRALAHLILSATDHYGAPQLRQQLTHAELVSDDHGDETASFAEFSVPEDQPRSVPADMTFPVIGRFRASEPGHLRGRSFDISVGVHDGRLVYIDIRPGADWTTEELEEWDQAGHATIGLTAWPSVDEVDLLVETDTGFGPIGLSDLVSERVDQTHAVQVHSRAPRNNSAPYLVARHVSH